MNQRVVVSAAAVALVALVAGGTILAQRAGGSHTPAKIEVQSLGTGSGAVTQSVAKNSAAPLMYPNRDMTFVLDGNLPALDGDRPAWHLAVKPTADPGTIATLAKALGLSGEVRVVDGGWQVGDQQAGPILFVSNAPGQRWSYSNSAMQVGYACASSSGGALGTDTTPTTTIPTPCAAPPPPTGVPTKDEALARVRELLKALSIDAGPLTFTANASEWSADVQAVPNLDGVAAPSVTTSFGFGAAGRLQYANGFLLAPGKGDSYPRVGTTKAFDALKSDHGFTGWFGFGGGPMTNGGGIAYGMPPITTAIASGTASASVNGSTIALCQVTRTAPANARPSSPPICDPCVTNVPAVNPPNTTVPCSPVPCLAAPPPATAAAGQKGMSPDGLTCGPTVPEPCGGLAVGTIPDASTVVAADSTSAPLPPAAPGCPGHEPLPPQPTTPPVPITITITGVHETLLPFMGVDGSMWLIPGYEFTSNDGATWPVLAVDQSYVDQVAPIQPTPKPLPAVTAVAGTITTAAG